MKDDLWKRAVDGDPADLGRLADREGAMGLLDALDEKGVISNAALSALPYADDAETSYALLGGMLSQAGTESAPLVEAIAALARRPMLQREAMDPPGLRSCGSALVAFARRTDLSKDLRAPAITALRLLALRHGVDPAAIPTDLDPK
ncbi:MAG TPA: hypothetical protein VGL13_09675 [Polyangiaceae bacterium]|jgi:hypothetical protein